MKNTLNIVLVLIVAGLLGWILVKPSQTSQSPASPTPESTLQSQNTNQTKEEIPMSSAPSASAKSAQYKQAEQVIDQAKSYQAVLHTTAGDITIALSKETPITTNNFVFLSQKKFYDGVIFHRVIPGFMIQGGDPTGTGMGGPGYRFADEPFTGEYTRGTVAMANAGPNTNGSQFFIMHQDYPLPPSYVIFGKVTAGLEVVDKIAAGKTGPSDRPVDPVVIKSVEISAK